MYKYIIVFFSILSTFNSAYLPYKKNKNFPEETCSYEFEENIYYVRDCEKGKYCNDRGADFSICENIPEVTLLNADSSESCQSNYECETGFACINSKCIYPDCDTGEQKIITKNGYKCLLTTESNVFYSKDFKWNDATSRIDGTTKLDEGCGHFQVGGKITSFNVTKDGTNGVIYEPQEIIYSDIGSVEDGDFVFDEKACKSGFALYFYGNGELKNPHDNYNYMYKRCVTLEDIEAFNSGECKIKYTLNDKTFSYNPYQYDNNHFTLTNQPSGYSHSSSFSSIPNGYFNQIPSLSNLCDPDLKIKTKIFQKYIGELTDDIRKCPKKEEKVIDSNNNEYYLETCQNDQLRKWSYLYEHPEYYVLYYDEDDDKGNTVINYLVQKEFPSYQSSPFLNIKYYICLLLLLLSL